LSTPHGFLGALLCVAVVLGAVLAASRVVRVMRRRRRIFARRWGAGDVGENMGQQKDNILSPAFETPKRKLRVSLLGLGGGAEGGGVHDGEGERVRDWLGGKDSPV